MYLFLSLWDVTMYISRYKTLYLHLHLHLGHLADTFIPSDLHLSEEEKQYIAVNTLRMFIATSAKH